MIIQKIKIKAFGGLCDYSLSFGEKMNIIEGSNEAGKTTIASFIVYMLYGMDKNEKALRHSWDGSNAGGSMTVVSGGKSYRIERESSQKSDSVSIYDVESGEKVKFEKSPGEHFLSLPRDIFVRSAYVGQASGSAIDGTDISGAIENLMFSADEKVNTARAIKKLDSARTYLLHKNEKGGKIYEIGKEIDELRARLRDASADFAKVGELQGQLERTVESIKAKAELKSDLESKLMYHEYTSILNQFDEFNESKRLGNELNAQYKALREGCSHEGFLPDEDYLNRLRELKNERANLRSALDSANNEYNTILSAEPDLDTAELVSDTVENLGGKTRVMSMAKSAQRSCATLRAFGIIFAVLGVVAAVMAVYFGLFGDGMTSAIITGGAFALCTVVSIILLFSAVKPEQRLNGLLDELDVDDIADMRRMLDDHDENRDHIKAVSGRLSDIEARREKLEEKYASCTSEIELLLEKWNKTDVDDAILHADSFIRKSAELYSRLTQQYETFNIMKKQLAPYDEEEMREKYPIIKEKYESLSDTEYSESELVQMKKEFTFTTQSLASLTERRHALETELASLSVTSANPTVISERIASLSSELEDQKKRYRAIVCASEALTRASESLRGEISPRLSSDAGKIMEKATGGKYRDVAVEHDLSMSFTATDGERHSVDFMSAGTSDLVYISLRLSLASLLSPVGCPPVIFDESFARFDDNRLNGILRILSARADEGGQVILLTSQKRDAALMRSIGEFEHIIV